MWQNIFRQLAVTEFRLWHSISLQAKHCVVYSCQRGETTLRDETRNSFEGDYRKHGIDAVFFFANNYSDISGSRPHKICLNLFQINWKGFIYSPLNNIFIGIFWNWMLFFLHKNASISHHFKPPIQKDNSCMHSMPMFH